MAFTDPYSAYRGRPGKYKNKTVNSKGFISTPEIEINKKLGTKRIVFLGGSSTAGTGFNLADQDTWPWITIDILKKYYPKYDYDFINAALGGYSTFESYGRLWSRIRYYSPDILVLYHGWNEIRYFAKTDRLVYRRAPSNSDWTLIRKKGHVKLFEPLLIDNIILYSQLLSYIRVGLSKPIRDTGEVGVVKQPTLVVSHLSPKYKKKVNYGLAGLKHHALVDAFNGVYKVIEEEIPQRFIIDATMLSGKPDYFSDNVHPTVTGSEKVAEIVANSLIKHFDKELKGRL